MTVTERHPARLDIPAGAAAAVRPTRRNVAVFAAVLGLALGLRIWGIAFGLPYDFTADEPHHIIQALRVGAGEGGPLVSMWHTVGKNGLDYILFAEYGALYIFWRLTGRVDGTEGFALQYLQDPTAFYLLGRLTIALLGAATCVIVLWIGTRVYNRRIGIGAALLAAMSYYHAVTSHIINVHVAMVFLLWAGVAVYLSRERAPRARLIIAGLLIGGAIALAYTAVVVLLLLLALVAADVARPRHMRARDAALLIAGSAGCIALLSPDLLLNAGSLVRNFSQIFGVRADAEAGDVRAAIDGVTILRQQEWTAYFDILLKPYNILPTVCALAGAAIGVWRREPWTLLLSGAVVCLLLTVSASDRGESESYLLAVAPALWLLSSRGVDALARERPRRFAAGLAVVAAVPLWYLVHADFTLTRPDTRVLAKQWIEATVPSGATILMDGMRFRFVQSPPLTPSRETVARRIVNMESSELAVSGDMLALYRTAAERATGPLYHLHSTVYGLEVEDLEYYIRAGFDYIVVSSYHESRFTSEADRRRYPKSTRFYSQLRSDPRFQVAYSIEPLPWQRTGPALTVFKVPSGAPRVAQDNGGSAS